MKTLDILIVTFLLIFILVICTLRVHATSNILEIDGQIIYKENIDYISRIQHTPNYSLNTKDSYWYFFVYFKNPQNREAVAISAKSKQEIDLYYMQIKEWIRERN